MNEKYVFDLLIRKKSAKLILEKGDSESRIHIALKLLTYLIFYEPALQVERSIGWHYKPDLIVLDDDVPKLWVDCGQISLKKAETLARKLKNVRFIIVKSTQAEIKNYKRLLDKRIDGKNTKIEYLCFEKQFVEMLASLLGRRNELTFYDVSENTIGIILDGEVLESELYFSS